MDGGTPSCCIVKFAVAFAYVAWLISFGNSNYWLNYVNDGNVRFCIDF